MEKRKPSKRRRKEQQKSRKRKRKRKKNKEKRKRKTKEKENKIYLDNEGSETEEEEEHTTRVKENKTKDAQETEEVRRRKRENKGKDKEKEKETKRKKYVNNNNVRKRKQEKKKGKEKERGEENKKQEKEKEEQRWAKGQRTRIVNVYVQRIKNNPVGKRRGMMELENWEEIIDNRTILAGDFNMHNPRWGSNKQKDSDHIISIIDQYNLTIHNNFEYTRHGNDNQQPSIMDLTLSAGPTINNWLILNDDEHHTRSDHRAISWETQEQKLAGK
jgi:hypothetical protein